MSNGNRNFGPTLWKQKSTPLRFSSRTVDGLPAPSVKIRVWHKFGVRDDIRDVENADIVHRFLLSHHKPDLANFPGEEELGASLSLLLPLTVTEADQH